MLEDSTTRSAAVQVYINGDAREVESGTSVAALIAQLQLEPRHVAVEINRELVPRTVHHDHLLKEGDRLEIVTLVGGG